MHHINRYRRSPLIAALALFLLAAGPGLPAQEGAGEYLEDTAITTKVKAAFVQDPTVSALAISVETSQGTVQLSGFANSETERLRAEELARAVEGVKAVKNDIRLK